MHRKIFLKKILKKNIFEQNIFEKIFFFRKKVLKRVVNIGSIIICRVNLIEHLIGTVLF